MNMIRQGEKSVMKQNHVGDVEYLQFPMLEKVSCIRHLFSTRMGGVSEGIFSSMNLSYTRGDKKEAVDENFRRIANILDSRIENFVLTDQTHTTNLRVIKEEDRGCGIAKERGYHDIDGILTNKKGIVLSAFFADCVPLYFVDPVKEAIALSHSGWRGTVGKIGEKTINAMEREFGSKREDIVVAIGPSICQMCYEVSADVAEEFKAAFPEHEHEILLKKADQKYQLDLWKANFYILQDAGILQEHIQVTDICTCCNPAYLFSHRASHGKRGNLGAFLMLQESLRKN